MTPSVWTHQELKGERWVVARLPIAPLELPPFSATWSRVDAERVHLKGLYRLGAELAEGVTIPDWLLVLAAMGLHVYGEGNRLIIQDRAGRSHAHDEYRMGLLERFVREHVEQSVDVPGDLPESTSEFAVLVRERVEAGFWDLPAREPMPGDPVLGDLIRANPQLLREALHHRGFPKMRAFRAYLESGAHSTDLGVVEGPRDGKEAGVHAMLPRPRTGLSRALQWYLSLGERFYRRDSGRGRGFVIWLLVFFLELLALPLAFLYVLLFFPSWFLYLFILGVEWLVLPRYVTRVSVSKNRSLPALDTRPVFIQLHDALTAEGLVRLELQGDLIAAEQWVVHMERVLFEVSSPTPKPKEP
jgi:hypothetical protein